MENLKEVRDWKAVVMEGGSLRKVELENEGVHGWASPPASFFMTRGACYLQKKVKVPCKESLLQPLGVDWLRSSGKLDHVLANPGNRVMQVADRKACFILAVNLQVPGGYSAVFYFVGDVREGSLLHRFVNGDDAFRNSRFKLINRIVKGPWIVKAAAGNHPACLLGKVLTCHYFRGQNYLEIDVDIGSSTVAHAILRLALGYVTHVSVDMAFLIEGQTEEELPEKLLGAVRIAQIEMDAATFLEAGHKDQSPLQTGLSWRKLGKSLSKLGSSKRSRPPADQEVK